MSTVLWEVGNLTDEQQQLPPEDEDLSEGYPLLTDILAAIPHQDDVKDAGVARIDLYGFASNEATFNIWYVGADEPFGGYINFN